MTRRLENSWNAAQRKLRMTPHLRALVQYMARLAAEEDFDPAPQSQRRAKTEEPRNKD